MDRKTLGPSPGARRAPDHRILIEQDTGHWTVTIDGIGIADSMKALAVDETGYERVIYFPPADVRTDRLSESETRTTCPFKGEAHYYAAGPGEERCDVAWYYPSVYDEVAPIAGYIAFYRDRVNIGKK